MERGTGRGYLPKLSKSVFILDLPGQEEVARREFAAEGLYHNFVSGSRYLGAYLGPQEELTAWVKLQLEAWAHGVRFLVTIARRHPHLDYSGLGMSLQLVLQYLNRTVPGVGTLMGTIEEALRDKCFPSLFGGEEINANFRQILGHSVNHGSLGIQNSGFQRKVHRTPPRRTAENW